MIKEEILVPQVETLVTSFTLLPAWRDRVRDILASRDERRAIETQRRAIEARLERKRIVYEEGDIDLVTYRAERDDLRRQLDALVVPREQRILDAGQFVEEMAGIWREATLQERHAMLKAIFAKVWVDRVTQSVVGVEVHPDFVPVFRQLPGLREEGGIFYVEGVQEKAAMGVRELVV